MDAHLNRLHRLSINIPIDPGLTACHTLRQQSWAGAYRLPESPGTQVERISWGLSGYPGVLEDMGGQVKGLSNEPEPKDQFCCKTQVLSYLTDRHDSGALTFSSTPWEVSPLSPVTEYGNRPYQSLVTSAQTRPRRSLPSLMPEGLQ